MRDSIHIYDEGLQELEADLSKAPLRVQRGASAALAGPIRRKLEREQREDASGHRQLQHLPQAIGSSMIGRLELEVGFNKVGQGELANIIAYGSVNNAPVYDFMAATYRSVPTILRELAGMAEDSVLGGGDE